jgi:hypothetical protein
MRHLGPVMRCVTTRPRTKILGIALAALAFAGCGSAEPEGPSAQHPPTDPGALNRVSSPGKLYQVTLPRDEFVLKRLAETGRDIGRVLIMARRGGRAFYRIGAECFATGPARPTTQSFSQIGCPTQFPSPASPILDFTVFHSPGASAEGRPRRLTVYRSTGFAADGVAKVAFVDGAGEVVAETPVVDNTYIFDLSPSGENLRIAAFSTTGERVFEQPKRASAAGS